MANFKKILWSKSCERFCLLVLFLVTCAKLPEHYCGDNNRFDPASQFCFNGATIDKCGGVEFDPPTQGCSPNGMVQNRCADGTLPPCIGTFTIITGSTPSIGGEVFLSPEGPNFLAGTEIIATMKPASGYKFTGWVGAVTSTSDSVTFSINDNKILVAMFEERTHTLTTAMTPLVGGEISIFPEGPDYSAGTQVTMVATPASGYRFKNWMGTDSSDLESPGITITMDGDRTLIAFFERLTHTLATSAAPASGGEVIRTPDEENYTHGTEVTVAARPDSGYRFIGWVGASTTTEDSVVITIDGNKTLIALFEPEEGGGGDTLFTLTPVVNPTGSGNVTLDLDAPYTLNTIVTATAEPKAGFRFVRWENAYTSTEPSVNILMDGHKILVAVFEPLTFTLTTNATPTVGGNITRTPNNSAEHPGGTYAYGAQITVIAEPEFGYLFTGWSGASSSTNLAITVTMDDNLTLTANFQQQTHTLTIDVIGSGSVSREPDQTSFNHGTQVTITAMPNSGFEFDRWMGAVSSTEDNITAVTMNSDLTVTAMFVQTGSGEDTIVVNGVEFYMVFVGRGEFGMGCVAGGSCVHTEEPMHHVTLTNNFYIGKYPVTQAQWTAVMGTDRGIDHYKDLAQKEFGSGAMTVLAGTSDNHPMYFVSWDDAQEFIRELNNLTDRTFRLPTEAEWEFAARGGNLNERWHWFAGSNFLDNVGWCPSNSTHPVGGKSPNELGIFDMSGNVSEWVSDWFGYYDNSPKTDPTGPVTASRRVNRGGNWRADRSDRCRVYSRIMHEPNLRANSIGFRLVLEP